MSCRGKATMVGGQVKCGLDQLFDSRVDRLAGRRLGLLVHPASVDGALRHATRLCADTKRADVRCLFGPQHGLFGETQDNMIEWEGFIDRATGLRVHSLYGDHRKPTPEMLSEIDTLVIDLQDVGARYYTFAWTMLFCMEACAEAGKSVVILDRPNPIGGLLREGGVLNMNYRSFVGLAPLPVRHGLTMGELALFFRHVLELDLEVEIVWMANWRRAMWFDETGLPWVMPSPNIPTLATAAVYPGFCLLEGTELSEGRGTTRPFEIFGAPFIDPQRLVGRIAEWRLPGCVLRPLSFRPTFQKHAGRACGGAQVHLTDREAFRPVLTATAALAAVHELWPAEFHWKAPPYEYEYEKLPIDILAGGPDFRRDIEAGRSPWEISEAWEADVAAFANGVGDFLHYD
jgi:uncharacterized protein YbbC (DUF1343 family)